METWSVRGSPQTLATTRPTHCGPLAARSVAENVVLGEGEGGDGFGAFSLNQRTLGVRPAALEGVPAAAAAAVAAAATIRTSYRRPRPSAAAAAAAMTPVSKSVDDRTPHDEEPSFNPVGGRRRGPGRHRVLRAQVQLPLPGAQRQVPRPGAVRPLLRMRGQRVQRLALRRRPPLRRQGPDSKKKFGFTIRLKNGYFLILFKVSGY